MNLLAMLMVAMALALIAIGLFVIGLSRKIDEYMTFNEILEKQISKNEKSITELDEQLNAVIEEVDKTALEALKRVLNNEKKINNLAKSSDGTTDESEFARLKTAAYITLPLQIQRLKEVIGLPPMDKEYRQDGLVSISEERRGKPDV